MFTVKGVKAIAFGFLKFVLALARGQTVSVKDDKLDSLDVEALFDVLGKVNEEEGQGIVA